MVKILLLFSLLVFVITSIILYRDEKNIAPLSWEASYFCTLFWVISMVTVPIYLLIQFLESL